MRQMMEKLEQSQNTNASKEVTIEEQQPVTPSEGSKM